MHFRILKMIATIAFLAALECIKFVFGRVSAPDLAGGADSAPSKPPVDLREGERRRREVKEGTWMAEGRPPNANSWIRPWGGERKGYAISCQV